MNKTLRRFLSCLLFIAGLISILLVFSFALTPQSAKIERGMIDLEANAVINEPEGSIDILFIGDSECYSSFVPLRLWEKHGYTSYNCGTSAQNLYYSFEFLQNALEVHSPKIVILETNAIYRDFSLGADIVHKFGRFFPVFKYHDRWKSLLNKLDGGKAATLHDNNKGYVFDNNVAPASVDDYMGYTNEAAKISTRNTEYVREIKEYCEQRGAKLVLVSAPSAMNWNMKRHNGVRALAEHMELEFIDLNTLTGEIGIDWSTDTRDKGDHLNYSGAIKVTDRIGEYIESTGLCPDHRSDSAYDTWNGVLQAFKKKHETDPA